MDLESRVAVLEEQTRTLAEGLARIEGKLDLLAVSVSSLAIDQAWQRGRLHWLWVPGAALLAAAVTRAVAQYLP